MKNLKTVLIIAAVFVVAIIYTIVAVSPMQKEIQFVSKWSFPVSASEISKGSEDVQKGDGVLIPFSLGKTIGYFTSDGMLKYKYEVPHRFSITSDFFVLYNSNSLAFTLQKPDGEKIITIDKSGFPYVFENRIFLFSPGGSSCSEYDVSGNLLWSYSGYSPIIDFSSDKNSSVLGFADGEVHTVSNGNGEILHYSICPGGSTYPVIYGVAVSSDTNSVACISGYDRQRFVLIRKNGSQQKIVYHEYLKGQVKEPVCVYFTKDSKFVFYNFESSLGVLDCKKLETVHFPLEGKVLEIAEIPGSRMVFVLSRKGEDCRITFIEGMTKILGKYDYKAKDTFVTAHYDNLYIGADDVISCVQVMRK